VHPYLIHASLSPTESKSQTASRSVQPFFTAHGRESLYFTMPLLPLKIAPSHGESVPLSNTWFLGPTEVHNPNGTSIGSAVFAGLTIVTDRPTDRPTDHATPVTVGLIYVRIVLLCGLIITRKRPCLSAVAAAMICI